MFSKRKNLFITALLLFHLAGCSSTDATLRLTQSAYNLYNDTESNDSVSDETGKLSSNKKVIIKGLNPHSPGTPKGRGSLILSIDGIKTQGIGDKAIIQPGEHIVEIVCYMPGSKETRNIIQQVFLLNKQYIISASHDGNTCEIFTAG